MTAYRLLMFSIFLLSMLNGCIQEPPNPPQSQSINREKIYINSVLKEQIGDDEIIGIWDVTASNYYWRTAIIKNNDTSKNYQFKGVLYDAGSLRRFFLMEKL